MQNDIITPAPTEEYDELGLTPAEVAELYEISARRKTHPEEFTPLEEAFKEFRADLEQYRKELKGLTK